MGLCTKALINQVLCEETVVFTRCDQAVPLGGIPIPAGSRLSGETYVTVLECLPLFQEGDLGVKITFFVQEELRLITPSGARFPLEFGFRFAAFAPLPNCAQITGLIQSLDELDCRTKLLSGNNRLTLGDNHCFEQCLKLTVKVKLLRESQLKIALCPPYRIPCC